MSVTDLEIIVGTYEEFLLGYKIIAKGNNKCRLVQSFADHSHRASVRSVSAKGRYLASGSADETITLYDMKSRKETGTLVQHHGTVNCLSFSPNGSHLLSGSEDGSIAVFRTGSWQVEKVFPKAHKGEAVTCISVHPSGKLALSVGTDATLRTWNLVKGRQAYATNLGKNRTGNGRGITSLLWSPDGSYYVIAIGTEVNVYDVATAGVIHTFQLKKKITCACFSQGTELVIGDEGGGLSFHSIPKKKQLRVIEAHENRVKCVTCSNIGEEKFLISASSGGEIKLWHYEDGDLRELCKTDSDCRITCLVVLLHTKSMENQPKIKKEKEVVLSDIDRTATSEKKSKSKRKNSEMSPESSKVSRNSLSLDVVCTRGQKWIVEEL
ncbi:p21-activated protein kinase-interacting protein 1-like [Periplaneta americana]|uniref:p21-activated protein kinase-interacting protein 1-like n=1 Tax=Periplaneta americana TaxID=6978 RepID=UPI0037E863AF